MRYFSTWGAVAILSMLLTGCGTPNETSAGENATTKTDAAPDEPADDISPEEEPYPTIPIGETVELNEAELTVDKVDEVDSYPTTCGHSYTATEGRSLHSIDITVTNTSNDTQYPDGQNIGSDFFTFRDTDGREMQFVFPDCGLEGEETFDGLMSGDTGKRPLLFEGATEDAQPGWIEIYETYDSEPEVILLDEDIELVMETE